MGRTAIVTGASRGLGLALTRRLVEDGWTVVGDGREPAPLAEAFADLGRARRRRRRRRHRPRPPPRARATARRLGDGRIDLLVNNAGGLGPSPLPGARPTTPSRRWRELFEVNVVAPLALVQLALPAMTGGTIVDITSDASVEAYEGWGGYGATKAALDHLGRVLAAERPDVRVLTVDPGDMRTQMHQDAFPGEDISDRPPPEAAVPGLLALDRG